MALLIRRLGQQRFGMWLMIYALSAWMAFAKFGLQFTLYTAMGQHAQTDRDKARAILSNAAGFVALIGAVAAVVILVFGGMMPWAQWLNVTDPQAVREAGMVTVLVLVMAALSMPMMMGGHAMIASQRGDLSQLIAAGAQLLMICFLVLGYFEDWSFPTLVVLVMSPPLVAGLAQWCVGLGLGVLPMPGICHFDRRLLGRLLSAGVVFMALDLATITLLQGGPIVLGLMSVPEAVVPYGAAYRLIGILIAAVMMISYAYWPAYSEAGQRGDEVWIRRGVIRSLGLMLAVCLLGGCVILVLGRPFISWWLGDRAVPSTATLIGALCYAICFGAYVMLGTPLSGLGRLKVQLVSACVMLTVFSTLGVYLSETQGATGLYAGQAIAVLAAALLNAYFLQRELVRSRRGGVQ